MEKADSAEQGLLPADAVLALSLDALQSSAESGCVSWHAEAAQLAAHDYSYGCSNWSRAMSIDCEMGMQETAALLHWALQVVDGAAGV